MIKAVVDVINDAVADPGSTSTSTSTSTRPAMYIHFGASKQSRITAAAAWRRQQHGQQRDVRSKITMILYAQKMIKVRCQLVVTCIRTDLLRCRPKVWTIGELFSSSSTFTSLRAHILRTRLVSRKKTSDNDNDSNNNNPDTNPGRREEAGPPIF